VRRSGAAVLWTGIGCAALVLVPTALVVGTASPLAGAAQVRDNHWSGAKAAGVRRAVDPGASSDFQVVPVQKGNGDCGANLTKLPVIGRVNFIRNTSTLYVGVGIAGAPNKTYNIFLFWQTCGSPYPYGWKIGTIRTGRTGGGTGKFVVDDFTSEYTGAFVDPTTGSTPFTTTNNDTPFVTLPY
jgi:hypothetical protein